ncbi:MAG TPA: hypothetical protein PLP33_24580 [Leptospiraceae bacterium]|nr:hypothetical protein [Leptospiraceae bacterium]
MAEEKVKITANLNFEFTQPDNPDSQVYDETAKGFSEDESFRQQLHDMLDEFLNDAKLPTTQGGFNQFAVRIEE